MGIKVGIFRVADIIQMSDIAVKQQIAWNECCQQVFVCIGKQHLSKLLWKMPKYGGDVHIMSFHYCWSAAINETNSLSCCWFLYLKLLSHMRNLSGKNLVKRIQINVKRKPEQRNIIIHQQKNGKTWINDTGFLTARIWDGRRYKDPKDFGPSAINSLSTPKLTVYYK